MGSLIRITLSLVMLMWLLQSCHTTKNYGYRGKRYSDGRIAQMENHTKKRKNHDRSNDEVQVAKPVDKSEVEDDNSSKGYSMDKVVYHAERTKVLRQAQSYLGVPYTYGGKNPDQGFDCSGFVAYVYREGKVNIGGGSAQSLSNLGPPKQASKLYPGDLVFFGDKGNITHVGIITMNDGKNLTMVHASSSAGITNDNITQSDYWSARLLYGVDVIKSHLEGNIGAR